MTENGLPELHLTDFDGPLEVLLHLIQQTKMDIYDIQIAEITDQYMEYIYDAKRLDLNVVGEYLVMAAKLMMIKSKMLLPTPTDNVDEEEEDPREDLVNQLLNYQRYKHVADFFRQGEVKRRKSYTRSPMIVGTKPETLQEPSPFNKLDLMAAFVDALKRLRYNQPMSTVIHEWNYTIESQTEAIRQIMTNSEQITFNDLTEQAAAPEEVITDFLAILEMAKYQEIKLTQIQKNDPIIITKGDA